MAKMPKNPGILGLTPDPDGPNGSMNRNKAPKAPKGSHLGDKSSGKGVAFGHNGGTKGKMGKC